MPPKKKQPPRNGYYFLMLEHKAKEEDRGRFITMKMAAEEVKDTWAYMDQADKDYYNKMADKYKVEQCLVKYNSLGVPISQLELSQQQSELEKLKMDEIIKDTIRHLDRNSTLRRKEFHVAHINYYCETETRHFIPAEIAVAKFSLENGVIDTLHMYVSPGELPLGYRFIATEHTNSTHKTPLDWDKGETDLNKLLANIKHFLKPDGTRGEFPPLYTMPDNVNTNASMSAVKGVLQELCINYGDDPETFRVYTLPKLFFELRNASSKDGIIFPTQSIAESELEKDVFNYTRGIACKYHDDEDVMQFCSLSTVQRWVFLICDHCCKDLDIPMVPSFHCPKSADVDGNYRKVWGPRRESARSKEGGDVSPPPSMKQKDNKPITIIKEGELRQPHKSTIMNRHPPVSGNKEKGAGGAGFTDYADSVSEKIVSPVEKRAPCWSSVAERSSHTASLPPTFDENNYPSMGGFSRGATGDRNPTRYNAWSGRGRGSRGRGLAANFGAMNLGDD